MNRRTEQFHYHPGLRTFLTSYPAEKSSALLPLAVFAGLFLLACGPYLTRVFFGG